MTWIRLVRHATWVCLALSAACAANTGQHVVLAPRPLPTPRTGQVMSGIVEAGISAGAVAELAEPRLANPDAGVHIPSLQGRADVRFGSRGIRNLELGFIHERGLPYRAHELRADSPALDSGASSAGLSVYYTSEFTTRFNIGFGLDTQLFLIPYAHYEPCTDIACETPYTVAKEGRSLRGVLSLSITPSYRLPAGVALFWGVTARNHPTIARDGDARVDSGPFSLTATGGMSYTHEGSGVRGAVHVYRVFRDDPVSYATAAALSLSIPLFREAPARPDTQPDTQPNTQPSPADPLPPWNQP